MKEKERLFVIINPENGDKKSFTIKEYVWDEYMGRNDLCFCGSGIKTKRCHADVHDKSVVANLLSVFNKLNIEEEKLRHSPCKKGCSDCCSASFDISAVEFFMILQYLKIANKKEELVDYVNISKKLIESLNRTPGDRDTNDEFQPCIFVDETSQECKVYEVRPTLCRIYGTYQGMTRCSKIQKDYEATKGLLKFTNEIDIIYNNDFFNRGDTNYQPLVHPMVYWFSRIDDNGKFQTNRMNALFHASTNFSSDKFLDIMLS